MSWAGTLEFNINDAYQSHLENFNTKPDDRVKVGEPAQVFSTSFEVNLEEGEKNNPSYNFTEAEGWSTASESIEVWSDEMIRDLGVQADAKNTHPMVINSLSLTMYPLMYLRMRKYMPKRTNRIG